MGIPDRHRARHGSGCARDHRLREQIGNAFEDPSTINYWVIGYPADTHAISRAAQYPAVALQWYLLHLPGIIAGDRSIYLREHHPFHAVVLFVAGFIDFALFLLLFFWLARLARRTLRNLSSPQKQTA